MQRLKQLICLLALLLAPACIDITHVQTGYVADRDECRGRSEGGAAVYTQPESYGMSDKDRNTALLQLFCECMKEKDWKVAGCPKATPPVQVAQTPQAPTVVVVQSPTAQPATMAEPVYAAPAPAPGTGKKKKKYVCAAPIATCPAPTDYTNTGTDNETPAQGDKQLQNILEKQ